LVYMHRETVVVKVRVQQSKNWKIPQNNSIFFCWFAKQPARWHWQFVTGVLIALTLRNVTFRFLSSSSFGDVARCRYLCRKYPTMNPINHGVSLWYVLYALKPVLNEMGYIRITSQWDQLFFTTFTAFCDCTENTVLDRCVVLKTLHS